MGASVSVLSPCTPAHNEFKELYNDKKAMHALFLEIASFAHEEPTKSKTEEGVRHLDIKDKICLSEILLFINRDGNSIFAKNLTKNSTVIKEAFKFAIGSKVKDYTKYEMGKKEFRKLVPALLLFSELYSIFRACDTNIDDDRIFPAEYARAHKTIESIDGVTVNKISEEEWVEEFNKIDSNKNGYITFNEFSKYCLAKIITPTFYMNEICQKADEEQEVIDVVGSQVVKAAFLHTLSNLSQKSLLADESSEPSKQETIPETTEPKEETEKENTPVVESTTSSTSAPLGNDSASALPPTPGSSKLTRQASSNFVDSAISQSVSSVQNAYNSSLI